MPENTYFVRIAKSESLAEVGSSALLVQLVCADHTKHTFDREGCARRLAREALVDRYPTKLEDMGYAETERCLCTLPTNLRNADFSVPCGCRVWYWQGC
jgi:hypothetical protein